jgi:alpha-tubulin suppressor-like RCC1 family protein
VILGLDGYHACVDGVCDAADAQSEAKPGGPCTHSSDCSAGDGNVVCSNSTCVSVSSVAEGSSNHECAVMSDGTLWCWGDNIQGGLGRGTAGGLYVEPRPVSVVTDPIVLAVVGNDYTCALTKQGDVYCWGQSNTGGMKVQATHVGLPTFATSLSGGGTDACAVLDDDSVYCWGTNTSGEDGCLSGNTPTAILPGTPHQLLAASANTAQVAVGIYTTCALAAASDTVSCFGSNAWGAFGNGKRDPSGCGSDQITVPAPNALFTITSGDFALSARDINGDTYWWGQNEDDYYNAGIILPTSSVNDYATPFQIVRPGTTQVSIGWIHSCVLTLDGNVTCWGESGHGTAGIYTAKANPTVIAGLPYATQIAAQRQFTCALVMSGDVYCWGNNQFDSLGVTLPLDGGAPAVDTSIPQLVAW